MVEIVKPVSIREGALDVLVVALELFLEAVSASPSSGTDSLSLPETPTASLNLE